MDLWLRQAARALARKYEADIAAASKLEELQCSMGYLQVNEKTFTNDPVGTVRAVRRLLGLGNDYIHGIRDWIRAPDIDDPNLCVPVDETNPFYNLSIAVLDGEGGRAPCSLC